MGDLKGWEYLYLHGLLYLICSANLSILGDICLIFGISESVIRFGTSLVGTRHRSHERRVLVRSSPLQTLLGEPPDKDFYIDDRNDYYSNEENRELGICMNRLFGTIIDITIKQINTLSASGHTFLEGAAGDLETVETGHTWSKRLLQGIE